MLSYDTMSREQSDRSQTSSSSSSAEETTNTGQAEDHDTLTSEETVSQSSTDSASYHFHRVVITSTPPAATETPRVHTITFPMYSDLHVSKQYLKIQKLMKKALDTGNYVQWHVLKTMQIVLAWKPLDDMNLSKLEYETTQFLGNVYTSSGDESNMSYDKVIFT